MNCWSGNPRDPPLTIQALTIPLGCLLELDDNTLLLKTSTYLSYKIRRNQARTELEAFFLLAFVGLEKSYTGNCGKDINGLSLYQLQYYTSRQALPTCATVT